MVEYRENINKREKSIILDLLNELTDIYGDFYITKENIRLFLRENSDLIFSGLKKGDKLVYDLENKGLAFIYGFSDKANRKYVKILAKDENVTQRLLQIINWNLKNIPLWVKVKQKNPIKNVFLKNGYRFQASRGREILLCRQPKKEPLRRK